MKFQITVKIKDSALFQGDPGPMAPKGKYYTWMHNSQNTVIF